jgi:outer membrane murein-binding lipoprotein Lpp
MINKIMNKVKSNAVWLLLLLLLGAGCGTKSQKVVFNVLDYGAKGDSITNDTEAIQSAIDAAAAVGNQAMVLIPGGFHFLIGTLELKSDMEFHLEEDARLLVSTRQEDYTGDAAIVARDAQNLTISGSGVIDGRAMEFMEHYEAENEWWIPKRWRPRLFILTGCSHLHIRDITIKRAPSWSLHMLGCENVLIDGIHIQNHLDVPNCDGIDPDHCRNVEIRNCHIACGDDAIVIKTTRQETDYGPSSNIWVHDCILETQDSGLKIGTETTQDIFNILFERCEIKSSCRGLTIQLRDEGNVENITFRDIRFTSRYHSDPWWGRGEAISFTAIPRNVGSPIGQIRNVRVENANGVAENSIRINGTKESRIGQVWFEQVDLTLNRWTKYRGGRYDNRPTTAYDEIEIHSTPGYYIRYADQVTIRNSSVKWGENSPDYFSHVLEAHDVSALNMEGLTGDAAHPGITRYKLN